MTARDPSRRRRAVSAGAASADADLLAASRKGDAEALTTLLERHEPRVYRFALHLCRHPEDAEDVLQESLLAAARGLRGFRSESSLSTWLYTIARSHCIKKRTRRRTPEQVSLEAEEARAARDRADPSPDPEAALASKRLEAALGRTIAGLERPYREVLVLRDVEGLTAAEVARVTGLSIAAVKSRLHRARLRVREGMAPLLAPSGDAARASDRPCPDIARLLSRYLEGDISARTCRRMEDHLASCSRCRASCDALRRVLHLCRTTPSPDVPPALQERVRAAIRRMIEPKA